MRNPASIACNPTSSARPRSPAKCIRQDVGAPIVCLIHFLSREPQIYTLLADHAKAAIQHAAESDASARCLAWFTAASLPEHAERLREWFVGDVYPEIGRETWDALREISDSPEWEKTVVRLASAYYVASTSYDGADFGFAMVGESAENFSRERVKSTLGWAPGLIGEVRRLSHEPPRTRGNWRNGTRKNPNRERLRFCYWWWDGTPHQTTIESTESKRCGLLRTSANRVERPAGMAIGRGRSSRFFALIGARNGRSTSSAFRGQFNSCLGIEPASDAPTKSTPIYTHSSRASLEVMQLH